MAWQGNTYETAYRAALGFIASGAVVVDPAAPGRDPELIRELISLVHWLIEPDPDDALSNATIQRAVNDAIHGRPDP